MSVNPHGRKLVLKIDNHPIIKNVKSFKKEFIEETKKENQKELISKIIDSINMNSLNAFYQDSNNNFKKNIDSLNLKLFLETEKYLSNKNSSQKCQVLLFIILFKQIKIYIEEIKRLNLIIINGKYDPKKIVERTIEIIKKQKELLTKEKLINDLKESKSIMEAKLLECILKEDKLRKEIQSLKKENEVFRKQLSENLYTNKKKSKKRMNNSNKHSNNYTSHPFHSSNLKNVNINLKINNTLNISNEKKYIFYNQENKNETTGKKSTDKTKNPLYKNILLNKGCKLFRDISNKKNRNNNNDKYFLNRDDLTNITTTTSYLNKKKAFRSRLMDICENNNNFSINSSKSINKLEYNNFNSLRTVKNNISAQKTKTKKIQI